MFVSNYILKYKIAKDKIKRVFCHVYSALPEDQSERLQEGKVRKIVKRHCPSYDRVLQSKVLQLV